MTPTPTAAKAEILALAAEYEDAAKWRADLIDYGRKYRCDTAAQEKGLRDDHLIAHALRHLAASAEAVPACTEASAPEKRPRIEFERCRRGEKDTTPHRAHIFAGMSDHHGIGSSYAEALLHAAAHWRAHEAKSAALSEQHGIVG